MSAAVKKNEIDKVAQLPAAVTPMQLLDRALAEGKLEVVDKLLTLQERWEKSEALKRFNFAVAEAKKELPIILKNREVDFTSPKGRTNYRYEDLAGIAEQIGPALAAHNLSYRFRCSQLAGKDNDSALVTVTCIIAHADGHFEENQLSAPVDLSGNKNAIQAIGSTVTYLQRYTLKAALGLAAGVDDDANQQDHTTISAEQLEELNKLITSSAAVPAKFCRFMKVERVEDIPAKKFKDAKRALEDFARSRREQGK